MAIGGAAGVPRLLRRCAFRVPEPPSIGDYAAPGRVRAVVMNRLLRMLAPNSPETSELWQSRVESWVLSLAMPSTMQTGTVLVNGLAVLWTVPGNLQVRST